MEAPFLRQIRRRKDGGLSSLPSRRQGRVGVYHMCVAHFINVLFLSVSEFHTLVLTTGKNARQTCPVGELTSSLSEHAAGFWLDRQ